jgi:hypothetical protein
MDEKIIEALLRQYDKKNYYIYDKLEHSAYVQWPHAQVPPGTPRKLKHLYFNGYKARRKPPPITLPRVRFMEFHFSEDWSTEPSPTEENQ